jgi:hypothetical protein
VRSWPAAATGAATSWSRASAVTIASAAPVAVAPPGPAAVPASVGPAAAVAPPARSALMTGQQIDQVIEVALLLRVRRRVLAAHHAHETDVVRAVAHHLQRIQEPREPVALDAQRLFDLGRRGDRPRVGLGGGGFLGRALRRGGLRRRHLIRRGGLVGGSFALGDRGGGFDLGRRFGRGRLGLGRRGGLGGGRLAGRCLRGRRLRDWRGLLGRLSLGLVETLAHLCRRGRRGLRRWRTGRPLGPVRAPDARGLPQDGARELGDGLHFFRDSAAERRPAAIAIYPPARTPSIIYSGP